MAGSQMYASRVAVTLKTSLIDTFVHVCRVLFLGSIALSLSFAALSLSLSPFYLTVYLFFCLFSPYRSLCICISPPVCHQHLTHSMQNWPKFQNEPTTTVSPFQGSFDICPPFVSKKPLSVPMHGQRIGVSWHNVQLGWWGFVLPSQGELERVYARGYHDANLFLERRAKGS